jgi:hypothetical protein
MAYFSCTVKIDGSAGLFKAFLRLGRKYLYDVSNGAF